MRKLVRTALLLYAIAALLLIPLAAFAENEHNHAHATNGRQVQKIGVYEAELVFKGADITLYVRDDKDQKVDTATLSATAIILAKGNQQKTVELKPAGDNKLAGKIDFPVEGKLRATVSLKTAAGEAGKGRYSLDIE